MTRKNLILIVLRAFLKILNRILCSIKSGVWAAFLRNDLSNIIFIQETCSVMIILELVLLD